MKRFHHRTKNLVWIVVVLAALLVALIVAVVLGPDLDRPFWSGFAGLTLSAAIAAFAWLLWRRPPALQVGPEGIYIPLAFKRPLGWSEIHRIRRVRVARSLYGRQDWLVVEPSPGVLAPYRAVTFYGIEMWLQKRQGVRIPLHGLQEDVEQVIRTVEQFRPVQVQDS